MNKKILSLILVLAVVFSFGSFAAETGTSITIVHTNDAHAKVEEGAYDGMGYAKIAEEVNALRAEKDNVLLLEAGDVFHGTTFATLEEGTSIVKLMNAMKYDVMVAGNHDFNYGQEHLLELADMATFPILGANVVKADGTTLLPEYVIKDVDGVKVAIFGICSPETVYKTHPDNVKGLTFEDPIATAKAMVKELDGKADIIIALTHIGLDEETAVKSSDIANAVPEIDVIIDGHSHSVLNDGMMVNGVLIAQTGEYTKNLGIVDLNVVNGKVTTKTASLYEKAATAEKTGDTAITALINEIKADQEKITSVIVSSTKTVLDGERGQVRAGETNLGDLIADAILHETGADVALTNGGGIRASIQVGDITKGDVITVLPFGNYIVTKEISGADIKAALEVGVASYPGTSGGFPQVGGIEFTFDANLPAGSRVVSITHNGQPLDMNKKYTFATNNFTAAGGDDYTMLADDSITGEYAALDEALIEYLNVTDTSKLPALSRINAIEIKVNEYTVKSGDVLWKIAKSFNTTWEDLAETNALANPNLIMPGQVLVVPAQ
ncbi:MAG: 5'-nucleotidase C-terminal domain-containing protein [Clostridia bacterium]|nr:5'-nucleotidase C-terminal domain-containing protein [Clostridia bacterium]